MRTLLRLATLFLLLLGGTVAVLPALPASAAVSTPVPKAGDVLYASVGTQLKKWPTSPDWKYVAGMLVDDGSNNDQTSWLQAPYSPGAIADYAVEADIQFVRNQGYHGSNFGIVVRATDAGGYWVGVKDGKAGVAGDSDAFFDYSVPLDAGAAFNPGPDWHTYRVEVRGNTIRLLIDGNEIVKTSDNRFLEGGLVGLFSRQTQVSVRSFKVIAL